MQIKKTAKYPNLQQKLPLAIDQICSHRLAFVKNEKINDDVYTQINKLFYGVMKRDEIMGGKTLTRADLAEAVVRRIGLPRNESADLVELVLGEISTSLEAGEQVKLSSFGSFGVREKKQRIGRNPKTGEEVPITPRRVLVFRPSAIMKNRIDASMKANGKK